MSECVCVCVCVCVRARECVRACVSACIECTLKNNHCTLVAVFAGTKAVVILNIKGTSHLEQVEESKIKADQ